MKYEVKVYAWNHGHEPQLQHTFDSATHVPMHSHDCAFDAGRDCMVQMLETFDFVRLATHSWAEEGDTPRDVPGDHEIDWAAFTHPVRGRVTFSYSRDVEGHKIDDGYEKVRAEYQAAADLPIYSAKDLYAMTPVQMEYEAWGLVEHYLKDWWPQGAAIQNSDYETIKKGEKIQVRYLAYVGLGSDESWTLATLWWKTHCGEFAPVAVLTYKGEDDEYSSYVTDALLMTVLVKYLLSFVAEEERHIVDANKPNEAYTEFWGHTLHEFYDVQSGLPKREPKGRPGKYGMNGMGTRPWGHYGLWGGNVKFAPEES